MRDFYDLYILEPHEIDEAVMRAAFAATVAKRESSTTVRDANRILAEIESDIHIASLWERYRSKFDFAVTLINRMFPGNLGEVRREREAQLELIRQLNTL